MNLNFTSVFAGIKALLPVASQVLTLLNPAAGAAAGVVSKIVNEVDVALPLAKQYVADLEAAKAGYTQEQWDILKNAKQSDDDAILALQPTT
jgi:hypothetical protein